MYVNIPSSISGTPSSPKCIGHFKFLLIPRYFKVFEYFNGCRYAVGLWCTEQKCIKAPPFVFSDISLYTTSAQLHRAELPVPIFGNVCSFPSIYFDTP